MPPRTRIVRAEAREVSDVESNQVPSLPPRGRGHGWGRGRGRLARQTEEPIPEDEPVNLVAKMRGVHQTLHSLVELLA